MIQYPKCNDCDNVVEVYSDQRNMYLCEECLLEVRTDDNQVDLPRLSKTIKAREYCRYTLDQMEDFIIRFKQQDNLEEVSQMIEGYKEKLSKYLKEIESIQRENRWVGMIKITKKLQKLMKTIKNSEAMKQISITRSVLEFNKAIEGIDLQGDQDYVDNIRVKKMIAQRLRDKNKEIDEVKEECKQIVDRVNKKNELLREKIRILEEEKINQLQEATQALRERDNSNIELQSQVKTLTKELKKNKELIKNLKEE
mmetsp:Transcript_2442/g.2102  ORF Transcript_2442/g.2102 Transcript_2442/m.2102 type:complete len:254 (+) Transcript_2442:3-764(+)